MAKSDTTTGGTRGIEKILDKWRGLIKSKKRMIISLEEIIQAKIQSIRPWIVTDREPLDGWQHRHFRYDRHGNRTWEEIFDKALHQLDSDGRLIITSYSGNEHGLAVDAIEGLGGEMVANQRNEESREIPHFPGQSVDRHLAVFRKPES